MILRPVPHISLTAADKREKEHLPFDRGRILRCHCSLILKAVDQPVIDSKLPVLKNYLSSSRKSAKQSGTNKYLRALSRANRFNLNNWQLGLIKKKKRP